MKPTLRPYKLTSRENLLLLIAGRRKEQGHTSSEQDVTMEEGELLCTRNRRINYARCDLKASEGNH